MKQMAMSILIIFYCCWGPRKKLSDYSSCLLRLRNVFLLADQLMNGILVLSRSGSSLAQVQYRNVSIQTCFEQDKITVAERQAQIWQ